MKGILLDPFTTKVITLQRETGREGGNLAKENVNEMCNWGFQRELLYTKVAKEGTEKKNNNVFCKTTHVK